MIGNKIGKLGEDLAIMFLKKHGINVFTRNHLKKYGEIDLIGKRKGVIHFVEVKAVSRENISDFSRETYLRPEENLHTNKLRRLSRVIQAYLLSNPGIDKWQFDLCVVYVGIKDKKAKIELLEDLVVPE